ncbi:TetR/AcrR family transcriptional regulator [Nocardia bovistercoris]|uniref:Helix-turn-helix transcriptional regulator n=1 Tax=Nocardia bovistercoris TaxID=2785916 RepID=A0A931I7N6_9NOCA|nr:TetR/AcrR family transcriptional regulator [Nocardia bovistercoris]MBH0774910.1 helix-turn-helix transcriptional regulator [Nocardia bovistercoris]
MAGDRPRERADAARNRRAILDATRALLAEHGAQAVTMEQVAVAAGVGKGTVFHRFGSRAGLLHELIAEPAVALMNAVTAGPPPLGPGASPARRLVAYFDAMTDLVIDNLELVVAYESVPPHPRRDEFHAFWAAHIAGLLREVRPDLDADAVGAVLLAPLGGELVARMVRAGEADRLRASVRAVVESVLRSP